MRKAEEVQTSYCMHDGLQLQRAGKALFLLLREPQRQLCLCRSADVPQQFWAALQQSTG